MNFCFLSDDVCRHYARVDYGRLRGTVKFKSFLLFSLSGRRWYMILFATGYGDKEAG